MTQGKPTLLARAFGAVAVAFGLLACVALVWLMVGGVLNNLAVAGPVIAGIVTLGVFAAGEFFSRRRIAQQYRWDKIADDYLGFVQVMRRGRDLSDPKKKAAAEADLKAFMEQFSDKLVLWGAPGVIRAWRAVMQVDWKKADPTETMLTYARVLVAIREDLGHTRNLDMRDLLGVTITDIDDYLPPGRKL